MNALFFVGLIGNCFCYECNVQALEITSQETGLTFTTEISYKCFYSLKHHDEPFPHLTGQILFILKTLSNLLISANCRATCGWLVHLTSHTKDASVLLSDAVISKRTTAAQLPPK